MPSRQEACARTPFRCYHGGVARSSRSQTKTSARSSLVRSEPARSPLRLTVTRGALGLELYEPVSLGPLEVSHLSMTLPGLAFPLDLSGGVTKFRNRRGELQSVVLRVRVAALSSWLTTRWQSLLGGLTRPVSVWSRPPLVGFGLIGKQGALAFELLWAPEASDARFVVAEARAVGLDGPALGQALLAIDTAGRGWLVRAGRVATVKSTALAVASHVLPPLGARVPRVDTPHFGELESSEGEHSLLLDSALDLPQASPETLRELELARLTERADDLLASGDLASARGAYVEALEQAPRHPKIAALIAAIDAAAGGRSEAALGLLRETLPLHQFGAAGAALLAEAGDLEAAREVVREAASREPFGPLAALLFAWLAEREVSGMGRLGALDQAIARAPSLALVRWQRFSFRAARGDIEGALADAEHLEASELGPRERHRVCQRAARALAEAGFLRDAGRLFERALRYLPDDALATAGLARSFLELGKRDRAVLLLDRAVMLSEKSGSADPDLLFDLACVIADYLHDYPQAIARIRQVPAGTPRATEARALEATWRARIGDLAGASLAYARLRDAVELAEKPPPLAADWLLEAARFERDVQRDALAAEQHLRVALALQPHAPAIAEAYREVAARVAEEARMRRGGR